ncbi:IS3 family transposase [bacterium]|nr:IS3 family transposase [bacterium]
MARSTYYYRSTASEPRRQDDASLQDQIERIALEYPRYGYRRITAQLQRQGLHVNRKRVLRIMKASDLLCRPLKGFVVTTNSRHRFPVYPNLYHNRAPSAPDQIWISDITYIRLGGEHIYLAVILDAFSRRVIGWALSHSLEADLVVTALHSALRHRHPPLGCIHHSDQGVQYACHEYTDLLKHCGFAISMSRKGNPYDNAVAESFFKTLKNEEVYLTEYHTAEEAQASIRHFIEQVYNQKRLHSSLGYVPPIEYELQYKQTAITPA